MVLKHSLIESSSSAQKEQESFFTPAANVMTPSMTSVYPNPARYHLNNSAPAHTFSNDYYRNVNPYFNPSDFHRYPPTVQAGADLGFFIRWSNF